MPQPTSANRPPSMPGPSPKPANDDRPDERKEGGPDFGRGEAQAEHADKSRQDATKPALVAPEDATR